MAARPEWITDIRFFATTSGGNNGPEARGSLTIADATFVQFTVWKTNDGTLQVTLPRRKNPNFDATRGASKENKPYFEEVGCVSGAIREEMTKAIVNGLIEERQGVTDGPEFEGPIPF